jgi:RNA recognition motif-containing protein
MVRPHHSARDVPMGTKLFVGNLTYGVTRATLEPLFAAHGTVLSVQVVYGSETGRSRGFALVEMGSAEEARAATAALTGRQVDGRGLTIREPRPPDSPALVRPRQPRRFSPILRGQRAEVGPPPLRKRLTERPPQRCRCISPSSALACG